MHSVVKLRGTEEDIALFSETKATQVCSVHQMKMSLFFFDSLISQADLSGHFHGSGSSLLLYTLSEMAERINVLNVCGYIE